MKWLVVFAFAAACGGGSSAKPDAPTPDVLACPSRFTAAMNYSVAAGSMPIALVSGDFNNDAAIDLAVADSGAGNVSILLGTAAGTNSFNPAIAYPVDAGPAALAAHDFDGDGNLDLAVANAGGDDLSLLHGNGDGTFEPPDDYPVAAGPHALVLGDFDGDGRLDIATAGAGTISVLLGGSNGELAGHIDTAVDASPLVGLTAGDFDHDGHLDLATGLTSSGSIAVLLGKGDGTFAAPMMVPTGTGPISALASADLDEDGSVDLVAASDTGTTGVIELRGLGTGAFTATARAITEDPAIAAVIGDFDGDTILDVAYATASSVAIAYATTPGLFAAPTPLGATAAPSGLEFGDFDRDGELDLATPNGGADSISIFLDHGCAD